MKGKSVSVPCHRGSRRSVRGELTVEGTNHCEFNVQRTEGCKKFLDHCQCCIVVGETRRIFLLTKAWDSYQNRMELNDWLSG